MYLLAMPLPIRLKGGGYLQYKQKKKKTEKYLIPIISYFSMILHQGMKSFLKSAKPS